MTQSAKAREAAPPAPHPGNPGAPFDLGPLEALRVNASAAERRAESLGGRRSVKGRWQAAWLIRALQCVDLTTLNGDDTEGRVRRLCAKARQPLRADLQAALGLADRRITPGAVCVYHRFVGTAAEALKGSGIPVAAVSTGFPAGLSPLKTKLAEIEASVADGAAEIDIVITRELALAGRWRELYDEIRACKQACGPAHMKTILATGDLRNLDLVAKASWVALMAGSDFIKTSTGKESVNATLPVTLVMLRAIRAWRDATGHVAGYKPAGGISTTKDALGQLMLVKEELGEDWLQPNLFRIGASSLVGDIERQLEHYATGRYAAHDRHGLA